MKANGQSVDGIITIAAAAGLPFSGADLAAHVSNPAGNASELSDFELGMVAGGTQFNGFAQQLQCSTTSC